MTDSTSVVPFVRRWGRRGASFIGRSAVAAVSVLVLAYGAIQLGAVILRAMLPLSMSVPVPKAQPVSQFVSMSIGEMLTVLETIPPVHLVGPVMVDPVMNTSSPLIVGVAVGLLFLGTLGITVAGTAPQLRQRTSAARESGLSEALPSLHDVFSLFHRNRGEVAQGAETMFVATAACIFMGWTATDILIPQVADTGGVVILLFLMIFVRIIPVIGLICATVAVGHVVWYVGLRWRGTRRAAGGDRR